MENKKLNKAKTIGKKTLEEIAIFIGIGSPIICGITNGMADAKGIDFPNLGIGLFINQPWLLHSAYGAGKGVHEAIQREEGLVSNIVMSSAGYSLVGIALTVGSYIAGYLAGSVIK